MSDKASVIGPYQGVRIVVGNLNRRISSLEEELQAHETRIKMKIDPLLAHRKAVIAKAQDDCPHKEVWQSLLYRHNVRDEKAVFRVCLTCGVGEHIGVESGGDFKRLTGRKPVEIDVNFEEVNKLHLGQWTNCTLD